jgi:uncharacterized protein (TIGR02466 family)
MYHPLFPTNAFSFNMIGDDPYYQLSAERFDIFQQEVYQMRKKDPIGRARSNADSGWQSNDGVFENPIFQPMVNRIARFFDKEVFPFYAGKESHQLKVLHGNYWANINAVGGYNNAHTHPGCWYSGTIYLKVPDGMNNGGLQLIDQNIKHLSMFPMTSTRTHMWSRFEPVEGLCILFPSGVYHFVEPNDVDADRISVAFNNSFCERHFNVSADKELPYGAVNTHREGEWEFYDPDGGIPSMEVNPDGSLDFPK